MTTSELKAAQEALSKARADLDAATKREWTARLEAEAIAADLATKRLQDGLTPAAVDFFAPEHCRTSCSDTNLSNGLWSRDSGPRCVRCGLLEALHDGYWPQWFRIRVEITNVNPAPTSDQ